MNSAIFVIVVYLMILVGIGYYYSQKVSNMDDFAVAGRNIAWPILLASSATSMIGGGASIGTVSKATTIGAGIGLAACAWYLSLVYSGMYIAPKLRGLKFSTIGDFFAHKYGTFSRYWIGIVSFVFCMGIVAAQFAAIGNIFQSVLGINATVGICIGLVVVVAYTSLGGMTSIMRVDVFQFLLLVCVFLGMCIYGLYQVGGYGPLLERLPQDFTGWTGTWSVPKLISVFAAFFLGELLAPYFVQRMYSAKDEKNAKYGVTGAGLFMIFFLPITMVTIGFIAYVEIPNVNGETALVDLAGALLPAPLVGLVAAAILACIISSCGAILSCCSIIATKDFYERLSKKQEITSAGLLKIGRGATLAISLIACFLAIQIPSVIDLLLYSYAMWAPAAVLPIALGVSRHYRSEKIYAVVASSIIGSLMSLTWLIMGQPWEIDAGVAGFVVAVIVYFVVPAKHTESMPKILQPA
ncbi:sodium:solute symporter [Photobacterium aphoticum]|uniref:Uncharacterized protein n=1 Tax=Photobacterium aphoticum TaxID=754436 RepID=A0A0J1GLS5_9GAMM|nr:sodium:solute symporter family protein [Photobacterium aphoticum]KLV00404.1 hypothetical protein ABT58_12085 [Photobacterium aphoticum]PSU59744.1 sodium:solute symporter family protein [Photobacterium aphoticum]GHA42696.1 sodium:solute symporter [Photobacterium aphoticum]